MGSGVKLFRADCFDVFPKIPADSIDLILADLPYGTTSAKWDTPLDLPKLWEQLYRIRKEKTPILLFGTQPFTSQLIASNFKGFKYAWVWDKGIGRGHLVAKYRPMQRTEDLIVFAGKHRHNYFPIMTDRERTVVGKESSRSELLGGKSKGFSAEYSQKYPQNVLKFTTIINHRDRLHPTQKPISLLKYLIQTYTKPGDLVLDFTMGSGSTGEAALLEGRRFLGVEKDPHYFEVAKERIRHVLVDKARQ